MIILAAAQNDDVLGYSYSEVEGPDYMSLRGSAGVLHDIVVDPAHRRNGVGRKLLEATLEALAQRGAPQVVLCTAALNEAAQRFFASAGFRRTMIEMTRKLGERDSPPPLHSASRTQPVLQAQPHLAVGPLTDIRTHALWRMFGSDRRSRAGLPSLPESQLQLERPVSD